METNPRPLVLNKQRYGFCGLPEFNTAAAVSASDCLTKSRMPPKFDIIMRTAFSSAK